MPIDLQIIQASDFMCFGADRHFDFEASRFALAGLARACRERGICRTILDLRGVKLVQVPVFSYTQVTSLLDTFYGMRFGIKPWLAVLRTNDPNFRVSWFVLIGRIHGWHVAAFDNFEEALLWLAGASTYDFNIHAETRGGMHNGIVCTPINVKKQPAEREVGTTITKTRAGKDAGQCTP